MRTNKDFPKSGFLFLTVNAIIYIPDITDSFGGNLMRKNNPINKIFIAVIILILVLLYIFSPDLRSLLSEYGIYDSFENTKTYNTDDGAILHVIDVGQGDSILLQSGVYNILIDAGPNSAEESLVSYLNSAGVDRLDCLVLTHPHEDHIGGADLVIETFDIDTVLMPDCTSTSAAFENVLDALEERELSVTVPERGDKFSLGGLYFTVLAPSGTDYKETNDYSIVLKAEYGDTAFMLTGDAEALSENEIIEEFGEGFLICDVLKAGHHGSSTSNTEKFVRALSPKYAAVSCGLDNSYGHPHKEIRDLFDSMGIEWYRTDYDGSIVFISDGKTVTVK